MSDKFVSRGSRPTGMTQRRTISIKPTYLHINKNRDNFNDITLQIHAKL